MRHGFSHPGTCLLTPVRLELCTAQAIAANEAIAAEIKETSAKITAAAQKRNAKIVHKAREQEKVLVQKAERMDEAEDMKGEIGSGLNSLQRLGLAFSGTGPMQ